MNFEINYYEVLGVPRDASAEMIRKAFRRLAQQCHPDKFAGSSPEVQQAANARFVKVNEAYSVLSDPQKRSDYDYFTAVTVNPPQSHSRRDPGVETPEREYRPPEPEHRDTGYMWGVYIVVGLLFLTINISGFETFLDVIFPDKKQSKPKTEKVDYLTSPIVLDKPHIYSPKVKPLVQAGNGFMVELNSVLFMDNKTIANWSVTANNPGTYHFDAESFQIGAFKQKWDMQMKLNVEKLKLNDQIYSFDDKIHIVIPSGKTVHFSTDYPPALGYRYLNFKGVYENKAFDVTKE